MITNNRIYGTLKNINLILLLIRLLAQNWAVSALCGTAKSCPTCALGLESMPGLEQAVKAQDVGRVDEARAHLTSRCGGWCLGRKSDEARRQCTWIRSRKQVLSSKVSMICCLWLVLILADQGSAESLVLMAGLNVVQVLEYYCCTYLLILTCRATLVWPHF